MTELADLRVRTGDLVTASGTVVLPPDRPARFCAPVAVARVLRLGPEQPPNCDVGVDLRGVDPDRLADPKEHEGTRWGRARITGRYAAGTVTVTDQGPPEQQPDDRGPGLPDRTPCSPPAGGWQPGPLARDELEALQALIEERAEAYGELVMTYPEGFPIDPPAPGAPEPTEVAMVTTTLDPAEAERELRGRHAGRYAGNLCVQPAVRSRADTDVVWRRVDPQPAGDATWRRHRVYRGVADHLAGRVRLSLVVLDDAVYAWLREVDAGTGIVDVRPWLRPATPR